jgi:recombinational DNA repair protein (RecF pathway)
MKHNHASLYPAGYLATCVSCGRTTSKQYASRHGGHCKRCASGETAERTYEDRNAFILDHGYDAYAREEGHYDLPDNY